MSEDEVFALDIVESCYAGGGTPKRVEGTEATAMTHRLKEAEAAASDALDWAVIGRAWLDFFGRDGLDDAIRCAHKGLPDEAYCRDYYLNWFWIEGAETWIAIGKYDAQYLINAQVWLRRAEAALVDSSEATQCARAWMTIADAESAGHAFRLLKRAESLFSGSESDQWNICKTWLQCFGEDVGGRYVREYCLRIGELPP